MVKEALCGRDQKRVDDEGRCQCRDEDDAGEGQIADIGRYRLPCEEPIAQGEQNHHVGKIDAKGMPCDKRDGRRGAQARMASPKAKNA